MKKMLLFQVGTEQYALDLANVKSIQSVKHIVDGRQESSNSPSLAIDDERTLLYDLISIFGNDTGDRDFENEKLIVVEAEKQSMGIIVSRVDDIVSIEPDRINPLAPIFKGFALSCFPNVFKHEDGIILVLAPQGLMNVLQIETSPGYEPPARNEAIVGIAPKLMDTPDIDDTSYDHPDAFPANLEQLEGNASP